MGLLVGPVGGCITPARAKDGQKSPLKPKSGLNGAPEIVRLHTTPRLIELKARIPNISCQCLCHKCGR
jgi:hypothetical protein